MDLTGKRVVLTGAGRGLGRAMAIEFARAGARVVVTDRDPSRGAGVVAEISGDAVSYALDVTVPEQIVAVCERIRGEQGPVDVLVNNAGVVFGGPFATVPLDRHVTTVAVNLTGVLALTHAFLPELL